MSVLIDRDGVKADRYRRVEDVADLSLGDGPVLVPLTVIDAALADGWGEGLGLSVANDTVFSAIAPYLDALSLVSIAFPSFSDGRGFSLARRLRGAGFGGSVRAEGPLIADQFAEALACGFSEIELPDAMAARQPPEQWRTALGIVTEHYQTGYGPGPSILEKRLAARKGAVA